MEKSTQYVRAKMNKKKEQQRAKKGMMRANKKVFVDGCLNVFIRVSVKQRANWKIKRNKEEEQRRRTVDGTRKIN